MGKKTKIFRNRAIDKKQLKEIMSWAFTDFGMMKASYLAHKLKDIGFAYATQAGLSLSIEDLRVPPVKSNLLKIANKKVSFAEFEVNRGEITEVERFQKVINTWNTTSETLKDQVINYFRQTDPLNSIYMMAFSGARGNLSQVRQLVGMRGLMADPNGQIIDLPIVTNFREGLTVTDYIISSYGARKGLVDTALRTADSGYLTRRLIDVAQDMITREKNCKTKDGISLIQALDGSNAFTSLRERIIGRLLAIPVKDPNTGQLIANADEEITPKLAKTITDLQLTKVVVRSPLTCSSSRSVCQQCYGWNLAYGSLIDLGEAVGIIAAQSIGEPGTQLTMRTFHTGGVFTTEPTRQIRAKFSGKIVFSPLLKTQTTRTQYGEVAFISENEGSITLITFANLKIKLAILPETLILAKDNSYIKKDDILFELRSTTIKTGGEKAFKNVYANQSGEIFLENEKLREPELFYDTKLSIKSNCLLWILSGQVFNIPLNSNLKIKPSSVVQKNQTIAEATLLTITGGYVKTLQENLRQTTELDVIYNTKSLTHSNIYLQQETTGIQKCILYGSNNRRMALKPSKFMEGKPLWLGNLINTNYRTKTGGHFYSNDFSFLSSFQSKYKMGGTIFYIPESTYKIHQDITQLYVKNGDCIDENTELLKDEFTKIGGIVEINENKKIVKELLVKPGRRFLVQKNKTLKRYHQNIFFPGESILDEIMIDQLSYSQVKTYNNKTFVCLYPIVRYEIIKDPNELINFTSSSSNENTEISLEKLESKLEFQKKVKENLPLQLISRRVISKSISTAKNFKIKMNFVLFNKKIKLKLLILESLNLDDSIPNELKKVDLSIIKLVQNQQFVEPYTKVGSFKILIPEENKITFIKEQYVGRERKILLLTNQNYKTVFLEQANIMFKKNTLIKLGEKRKNNYICQTSGLIYKVYGDSITFHLGQPYLFSQGAIVEKRPGDLIKQGESLGQLVYERARTGDIVQGLPRVEEILEGRKPKWGATIASFPGIVSNIIYTPTELHIWITPSPLNEPLYTLSSSQRLLIGKFDFINVGQPLNDASINPHETLDIHFLFYRSINLLTPYQAAYRSLRKIQAVLLNSVQAVYYSQGVSIADKHVEIIIKQMTGKVEVTSSGDSPLLQNELVDLRQVYYINNCLKTKETALFQPVLLGITKASLKTNSFISAASFQHTTRVLIEAAIQGKIDWLRGLKENVIVGRLIPSGTGFNAYSDISYIGVKIPSLLKTKNTSNAFQSSQIKYKELKDRMKFKFVAQKN